MHFLDPIFANKTNKTLLSICIEPIFYVKTLKRSAVIIVNMKIYKSGLLFKFWKKRVEL